MDLGLTGVDMERGSDCELRLDGRLVKSVEFVRRVMLGRHFIALTRLTICLCLVMLLVSVSNCEK